MFILGTVILMALMVGGTLSLVFGLSHMLSLAIDIAAKLEPEPKHTDQFEAYKKRAANIGATIAGGLALLALGIGFVAHGVI